MNRMWAAAALIAVAGQSTAQQAARTVQQDFDAAEALDAGTDKAAALAAWQALEQRVRDRPRSRAIVLVRKSAALLALDRKDEAVTAAQAGLAILPADDASLRADRFQASLNLGRIAMTSLDYATAADWFAKAEATADSARDKIVAALSLVQTATFTDPAAAAAAQTRLDGLVASAKLDRASLGTIAEAKGILSLNRGDIPAAQATFRDAVRAFGGINSNMIDLHDVSVRSDAAIAYLLGGNEDEARRYVALTGAGAKSIGLIDPGVAMVPPDCGGEEGLKPNDMAVVEFSIADDGTARGVRPIYAAGGGKVALAFAQAVRQWSWIPDQVKSMPTFLRYNARVEMRCNLAFPRPSINDQLEAELIAWGRGKGLNFADRPDSPATAIVAQRRALKDAASGGDSLATLPALFALIRNPVVPRDERGPAARRALAIAVANGAPATARLDLDLEARTATAADLYRRGNFRRIVEPMLGETPYASDSQARAALRLLLADRESDRVRRDVILQQVAQDKALAAADPLKVGALIRLASLAQERGDLEAARTTFAASGLAANQCALIDKPPQFAHAGGTYPQEAQRWGMSGWTRTQFDVDPDGRVLNERAIISYPPFVFTKAGVDTIRTARFSKTYRPDGSLGCGALTKGVRFSL
ncbi:hypothetical protein D9601_04145 [Sphingomonas sp. MA1305]|uniref:energy transducer TonB n=1 Tax=Sphingomonas sp. MA1305 TaxID=2479204 RepID=UPI0018DFF0EE|nr:energy transducer TonB [Sphingomonas sp. MA1305]MBI0474552.1 hypothetical protein [Sphingomonas sp. MA1305]